jgi:hypothetical protein
LRGFANQQAPARSALRVVLGIHRIGHIARLRGTHARQRSQHDTVSQVEIAYLKGRK